MREVVYLSDSKLRQFLPLRGKWWPLLGRVHVSTPLGGADLEQRTPDTEADRVRRLQKVVKQIQQEACRFTEPDIRAGQWIEFQAPLHHLVPHGEFAGLLLFLTPAATEPDMPRLLLHGSADHLVGGAPTAVESPASQEDALAFAGNGGASDGPTFLATVAQHTTDAHTLLTDLVRQPAPTDDDQPGVAALPAALAALIGTLERQVHPEAAALMHGFARVTANVSDSVNGRHGRCLVASPLLVEYTRGVFD